MIKQYYIITVRYNAEELPRRVNKALAKGWELVGGPIVNGTYIGQAVTRDVGQDGFNVLGFPPNDHDMEYCEY